MNAFEIAARNVRRNGRRSALTLTALAVGAMAILVFGGYVNDTIEGLQTSTVRHYGHLQIVPRDYLDFGRGNPARFSIRDYDKLIGEIKSDAVLAPMLTLATPVLDVEGVAGNFNVGSSTSFAGQGVVPSEHARQLAWDGFDKHIPPNKSALSERLADGGMVGLGMAQLLSLCDALKLSDCKRLTPLPTASAAKIAAANPAMAGTTAESDTIPADIAGLGQSQAGAAALAGADSKVVIDLLAAAPTGMPNVVRMQVIKAEQQGIRAIDGMYVAMPLGLAQRLVYGPDERAVSAIVIQLKSSEQLVAAQQRLERLLAARKDGLEVLSFHDVSPVYDQIVSTYHTIFQFITWLMGAITLFSIANAVNMAVSERTGEIGTLRSLGFQRRTIRAIFISEGVMLGLVGSVCGSILAIALSAGVNLAHITWTPPGRTQAIPVFVDIFADPSLILYTIIGLSLVASVSAVWPAGRAAQLEVTEALRHA